jgi:hypothetical protein
MAHEPRKGIGVDPRSFDSLVTKLGRALTRRSLVGGSLGASVLAALGMRTEVSGQQSASRKVRAQECVPQNRLCGCRGKKGKKGKGNDHCRPCSECCHNYFTKVGNHKRCACKPVLTECGNDSQCCSQICRNGVCQVGPCAAVGEACDRNVLATQCCIVPGDSANNYAFCHTVTTAPAGTCVQCLPNGSTCNPDDDLCCHICNPGTSTCVTDIP